MFKIENKNILITRGDMGIITFKPKNIDGTDYIFKSGDVVRISVSEKKNCNNVVLKKDVTPVEESTEVDILLNSADTKLGDIINKPKDYWYEIVLNPDTDAQTIIGYDEDGPKLFTIFPENDGGVIS